LTVVDLAGQMLEKAIQLIEIAVRAGQEARWIDFRRFHVDAHGIAHLNHELVAKALDAALNTNEITSLKTSTKDIGLPKGARNYRAGPVAQLDGQVWQAATSNKAILPRAGEYAAH
jgi:hypothetical protein